MKKLLFSIVVVTLTYFVLQSCAKKQSEPVIDLREAMQERMTDVLRIREALDEDRLPERVDFINFKGLPISEFVDDVSEYQAYFEIFDEMYEDIFTSEYPAKQFNVIIQSCAACHENVCPGPLRAIRRLEIDETS